MDTRKLASSWISAQKFGVGNTGYDSHSWAVSELIELAVDDPEKTWILIKEILKLDDSDYIVKSVGAGPLEDLMVYHGKIFIERIQKEASMSDSFKNAMQNVWLDSDDTDLCVRFYEIAGIDQPFSGKRGR
ncbi:MAG: hypothetical protein JAY90_15805 [Candidatus Thiodiazotropha lotti]|nr:hypothetical protein [Candidatus Thiodiazotropha lotti]